VNKETKVRMIIKKYGNGIWTLVLHNISRIKLRTGGNLLLLYNRNREIILKGGGGNAGLYL